MQEAMYREKECVCVCVCICACMAALVADKNESIQRMMAGKKTTITVCKRGWKKSHTRSAYKMVNCIESILFRYEISFEV